jgi:hypothetical protein
VTFDRSVVFSGSNECTDNLNICNAVPNSQCNNLNGSYECNCVSGYQKLANGNCQGRLLLHLFVFDATFSNISFSASSTNNAELHIKLFKVALSTHNPKGLRGRDRMDLCNQCISPLML